jgi:hypothetical protein
LAHTKLIILIDILKTEIEGIIGRKINNRGDCEYLSNAIFDYTSIDISFNTLRRIYGLLPPTNPNIKTLNTLALFLGYNNFFHFSQTYHHEEKIQLSELIYGAIKGNNDDTIINIVNNSKNIRGDFLSLIIILIRELLHNEKYILIDRIFKLKSLDFNSFSYFEVLRIGNSIGLLLQEKRKVNSIIFTNENFIDFVYMTFVDYSNLNNYYGDVSEIISKNRHREDITIFSRAILEFRNFLNKKAFNHLNIIQEKKTHPILSGRLLALKLLATNPNKTLQVLKIYHAAIKEKGDLLDHYFELFTTSVLLKNVDLMRFLINNISVQIRFYHHKIHVNSFYLMCLFYYRLTGDVENENRIIAPFKLSNCLYSYQDFMNILWLTYQFNTATENSEKKKIKSAYLSISKELKFDYFSESFLLNYFG